MSESGEVETPSQTTSTAREPGSGSAAIGGRVLVAVVPDAAVADRRRPSRRAARRSGRARSGPSCRRSRSSRRRRPPRRSTGTARRGDHGGRPPPSAAGAGTDRDERDRRLEPLVRRRAAAPRRPERQGGAARLAEAARRVRPPHRRTGRLAARSIRAGVDGRRDPRARSSQRPPSHGVGPVDQRVARASSSPASVASDPVRRLEPVAQRRRPSARVAGRSSPAGLGPLAPHLGERPLEDLRRQPGAGPSGPARTPSRLRHRLDERRQAAAGRGEVRRPLPPGLA